MDDLNKRAPKWYEDKWGIKQGNDYERECKRIAESFNDYKTCDRCGAMIFPYDNDTLCRFCSDFIQRSGGYPWNLGT